MREKSHIYQIFLTAASALLLFGLVLSAKGASADRPFPDWVFGHVVWEDESTTSGTYDLVKGYLERGMPVDAVIIDSPWETAYNTFEFDPERYPDAQKLIDDLHANGIKVILWITPVINLEDPEYSMCLEKGYFVKGMEKVTWWKGPGGWIDYANPEALEWFHARMNKAIDMGIDGWKCDGVDPYVILRGWKARKSYSRAYYSDFYNYTRERSGRNTVVMARPLEQILNESRLKIRPSLNPLGLGLYFEFAPVEVSYMSWVGDQDPTFSGMKIAQRWILDSADYGYQIIGSDIGGYRGGGPEKETFIRWAQFGAFCSVMENGGVGEHRPWAFDEETLSVYRQYVHLHKGLKEYFLSETARAMDEGETLIRPLKGGRNHYMLGRSILVAPIDEPGGKKKIVLPEGSDWVPMMAHSRILESAGECEVPSKMVILRGGCSFTHRFDLDEYPAFMKLEPENPNARDYSKQILRDAPYQWKTPQ